MQNVLNNKSDGANSLVFGQTWNKIYEGWIIFDLPLHIVYNNFSAISHQTESVPIATYNQLLDANHYTMTAVKEKSKAAADQMNIAAKNAEQAVRCVHGYFL